MRKYLLTIALGSCAMLCSAQCPPITPAWALGHIVWEDSLNTTAGATRIVDGYLERGISVDGIIIDSPWSTSYNDFKWDHQRYADPIAMQEDLARKGVRTILWLTGNVNITSKDTRNPKSETYDEVVSKHLGVNGCQPSKWWKGEGLHVDFTSEKATQWWYGQLDKVFDKNVYGWKVDQGEVWLPDMIDTSIGKISNQEFRHYYYDAMFDYTIARKSDGIIIARPFSHQGGLEASVEKISMGWCGDFSGDWNGLKLQIDNIYRSSQYGYGAVGCEVGGFYKAKSNQKQFMRYAQFGCMTACIINGGENGAFSAHLPWWHGEDVLKGYSWCVSLMKELKPYKFSVIVDAHQNGGSLMKNTSIKECSHMLGPDIFTKAITSDVDSVSFHLPGEGRWVDFWTGSRHEAGELISKEYPLAQFPLFVREGAIIPLFISNSVTGLGDESMKGKQVIFIVPNGKSSRLLHLPTGDGIEYHDCQVSFDEKRGSISVKSDIDIEYVFIIWNNVGGKNIMKEARGKEIKLRLK